MGFLEKEFLRHRYFLLFPKKILVLALKHKTHKKEILGQVIQEKSQYPDNKMMIFQRTQVEDPTENK